MKLPNDARWRWWTLVAWLIRNLMPRIRSYTTNVSSRGAVCCFSRLLSLRVAFKHRGSWNRRKLSLSLSLSNEGRTADTIIQINPFSFNSISHNEAAWKVLGFKSNSVFYSLINVTINKWYETILLYNDGLWTPSSLSRIVPLLLEDSRGEYR